MLSHCGFLCWVLVTLLLVLGHGEALHLKGRWTTHQFFEFMAKFGFQQTDMNDKSNTQGYIYGNITSPGNNSTLSPTPAQTFVVVDSEYFLQYYSKRTVMPRRNACPAMFNKIQTIAWDSTCNVDGDEDFLRNIPCPQGKLCADENLKWVIPGYQFTYRVQDTNQPRFWYISMVSCYRETFNHSCSWAHDPVTDTVLDYDIWLVNGHPHMKHINPFEHQFSFDHHDTFEMYITFFVAYCCLIPIQVYALVKEKHMMPFLLTLSMGMEFFGVMFNFIHVCVFAFDGEGVDLLKVVGNFIDNLAQCIFMLLLLLTVKGWTITRRDLGTKSWIILFTVWSTYTTANMALFIWNLMEVDQIYDIGEWQTWPGWLILIFRIIIMVWFLFELRETILLERSQDKSRFYLHFGAGFLVWFVYLPIIAVICTQISSLWRYKTLLSVTYSADFLSYCVLVHLLWPSRSANYFNLKAAGESSIILDEIEYTDESDSDATTTTLYDQRRHVANGLNKVSHRNGMAYMSIPNTDLDSLEMDVVNNKVSHLNGNLRSRPQCNNPVENVPTELCTDSTESQKGNKKLPDTTVQLQQNGVDSAQSFSRAVYSGPTNLLIDIPLESDMPKLTLSAKAGETLQPSQVLPTNGHIIKP